MKISKKWSSSKKFPTFCCYAEHKNMNDISLRLQRKRVTSTSNFFMGPHKQGRGTPTRADARLHRSIYWVYYLPIHSHRK